MMPPRRRRTTVLFSVLAFATAGTVPAAFAKGPEGRRLDRRISRLLKQHGGRRSFVLPDSKRLRKIPADPKNPLSFWKVTLGRLLYHEPALSAVDTVQPAAAGQHSCASCHFAQAGFQAGLPQGIAEGGEGFGINGEGRVLLERYDSSAPDRVPDVQPIRSPSILNGAYQELMLWNGQFGGVGDNLGTEEQWVHGTPLASNRLGLHGLETQAHAGLAVHRMDSIEDTPVAELKAYRGLFRAAFPKERAPINRLNAAKAIAAFERTVLANHSPWQRYLRFDRRAMTKEQKRGAILFFGKANCVSCHAGPALNGMTFHALGMLDIDSATDPRVDLSPFGDTVPEGVRRGRGGFTGRPEDDFRFKTPQLYNLADSPFYGHGATFTTIRDVIVYKNRGVPENAAVPPEQLAPGFHPLGLTDTEIDDLAAFVEEALYDHDLERYAPHGLPSGLCTPNDDPQSRIDLGCDRVK